MITNISYYILYLLTLTGSCSLEDNISIKIEMTEKMVSCEENNFKVNCRIENTSRDTILIPDILLVLCNDPNADISYVLEQYNDSSGKFQPLTYSLDLPPVRDIKFRPLPPNQVREEKIYLPCHFSEKGRYRLKLELNLKQFDNGQGDYSSNVVEFSVTKPFIRPKE